MSARGVLRAVAAVAAFALAAVLIGACGGTTRTRSQPMVVHLDGRVTGDYLRETSATGTDFLVPSGVLAGQGTTSFDIAAPPPDDSDTMQVGPKLPPPTPGQPDHALKTWFIGPSITGTTPARAHVELLVTGDSGRRIYLSFEESCGRLHAPESHAAIKGAHGQRVLRTPAVMIVPALAGGRRDSCYVSGVVVTRGRNDLHLSLIDY